MGRLLSDLGDKMQSKAAKSDRDPMKILIHSTHDTTLAAICQSLDVYDEKYVLLPSMFFSYINVVLDQLVMKMASFHIINNIRVVQENECGRLRPFTMANGSQAAPCS